MTQADVEDLFPVEILLKQEEGMLYVTWSDEHVSPFPLSYIRGWCPCARCQGHFTAELHYQEVENLVLENVEPVGNYGVKLSWADGHNTGIYTFEEVRNMCTCEQCDPDKKRLAERVRPRSY